MTTLSAFTNYILANREARLTGPREIINDAVPNNFLLGKMLKRRSIKDVVRSGTHIEDRIKLLNQGNFGPYVPGSIRTLNRRQTIFANKWAWRTYENHLPVLETELDMSEGDEYTVFKRYKDTLDTDLMTDHIQGLESLLWNRPNATTMESMTLQGGDMYSILCYVTENGLAPPGWTTVAQLAPATYENWRNPFETYDASNIDHITNGIFAAFDRAHPRIGYEVPEGKAQYYENDDLNKLIICTNLNGRTLYSQLLRAGNDSHRAGPQDPSYGNPVWQGVPVMWANALDTANVDQSGGSYTEQPYPTGRPRYFMLNCKYIFPVFHPKHMMNKRDPINAGALQRDVDALYVESWGNLICRSRKRHAVIRPL